MQENCKQCRDAPNKQKTRRANSRMSRATKSYIIAHSGETARCSGTNPHQQDAEILGRVIGCAQSCEDGASLMWTLGRERLPELAVDSRYGCPSPCKAYSPITAIMARVSCARWSDPRPSSRIKRRSPCTSTAQRTCACVGVGVGRGCRYVGVDGRGRWRGCGCGRVGCKCKRRRGPRRGRRRGHGCRGREQVEPAGM